MDLNELLYRWINEYAEVLDSVKQNNDFKNPFRDLIAKTIPDKMTDLSSISDPYIVVGSYGKGRWTDVPWIAIFDKRITTSAQKGVYIVYLLNKDKKELYLTFEIAATEVMEPQINAEGKAVFTGVVGKNSPEFIEKLSDKAANIREKIQNNYFKYGDGIDSGARGYDYGAVYYKKYTLVDLPTDEVLISDLQKMIEVYRQYYNKIVQGITSSSSHSVGEFYSWEILSETTAVKHCDKSFFEHNGSGVPKEICWFFDADSLDIGETRPIKLLYDGSEFSGRIANDTTDRRRVRIFWNTDLGKQFTSYQGEENAQARFDKVSDAVYEISFIEEKKEMAFSVSETIEKIKSYISSEGFSYEDGLIENFYLSLKSKPFVILAGTSGTGKTRLVKLFAKAIGATTENGRFKMVSVRPDWSDSTDLFGHVDLNGKFVPGAILDFVKDAEDHFGSPYFLCLDEMNLARVEYYLSDILSIIETRDLKNGQIVSDPLISNTYYGVDHAAASKYGTVCLPENLYLIGTVNMDETTFPFSRKVLDRANTIEFSFVDLLPNFDGDPADSQEPLNLDNSFLKTEYLLLKQCSDEAETVNEYCSELQDINKILQRASAHVGYRVRDEIVFYLLNNKKYGLLSENEAMDNELMQKILPRIQGSSISVKNMLCDLFKHCAGDYDGYQTQSDDVSSKMMKVAGAASVKYPHSAEKIAFMVRRFEEDGFTSYWL